MLLERPEVEKALEDVFQREGLSIRRVPEKHAGGYLTDFGKDFVNRTQKHDY